VAKTKRAPFNLDPELSPAALKALRKQNRDLSWKLVERITPWLVEVGSWFFGGLIALMLFIIASLITVGPVDPAITVASTTFALALPLAVAGLFLLRLVQDKKHIGFEEELEQVIQEAGLTSEEQTAAQGAHESQQKRRTDIVLSYACGILALSILLVLAGMVAALWHLAWWIGVVFLAMSLLSLGTVLAALITLEPPDSPEQQQQKRRLWEEMIRQAKERGEQNEQRA